jgi:hypothetical protein
VTLAELQEFHTAGGRDLAGWPRCTACGFRWPCPELRNALPEQTADELEIVALVDIGWTVWRARAGPGGWDDSIDIGGTVIGLWDDADGHRWFRCLDFPKGQPRFVVVAAGEVDVTACSMPNASTLRSHARRLAREFSQRKGILSEGDLRLLDASFTLAHLIA